MNKRKQRQIELFAHTATYVTQPIQEYYATAINFLSQWHYNEVIMANFSVMQFTDMHKLKETTIQNMKALTTTSRTFEPAPVLDLSLVLNGLFHVHGGGIVEAWQVIGKALQIILDDVTGQHWDIHNYLKKNMLTTITEETEKRNQLAALNRSHERFLEFTKTVQKRIDNVPDEPDSNEPTLANDIIEVDKTEMEMKKLYEEWAELINMNNGISEMINKFEMFLF